MISVLIVDDQPTIRFGLGGILKSAGDILVVGEANTGASAVELARLHRPDVVLMDLRMPGMDGVEATRTIRADANLASVKILVLTTFETDDYVLAALRAGAHGFLGKGAEPIELISAVRTIHSGGTLLSEAALRSVVGFISTQPEPAPDTPTPARATPNGFTDLTSREREIVVFVAQGKTNQEIANRLNISVFTVKTHVYRAMAKLDVNDRSRLVVLAYENGLI